MKLIILKLVETLARAMFVLLCIFRLPVDESGQFGIFVTLVGLSAFFFGYERHIDIQRTFASETPEKFDRAIVHAMWLYGFNYLLVIPFFVILIIQWVSFSLPIAFLCISIVIGEHVGNQSYLYSIVNIRYRNLVYLVALKNVITFLLVAFIAFFKDREFVVATVLKIWAISSILFTFFIFLFWMRFRITKKHKGGKNILLRIFAQYKYSSYHFCIGLVAILALQLDRLMVGSLLNFADVGIYFRHIMLVSFMYQFFNIVSFNRVLPSVFANSKNEEVYELRGRLNSEYIKVLLFTFLIYISFVASYNSQLRIYFDTYEISIFLLGILFFTFIIRAIADLNGLIYNAKGHEKKLLYSQFFSLLIGFMVFVGLTKNFGIVGAVTAGTVSAMTYLLLILINFRFFGSEVANAG